MTTNDEQYVPSDEDMRSVWVVHERDCGWEPHPGDPSAEFDRFLARVRRDAAREALGSLQSFARECMDGEHGEIDAATFSGWHHTWAAAMQHRVTCYPHPEETP